MSLYVNHWEEGGVVGVEGRLGLGGGKVGSGWREERVRSRWREGCVLVNQGK